MHHVVHPKTTIDGLKRICRETQRLRGEDRSIGEGVKKSQYTFHFKKIYLPLTLVEFDRMIRSFGNKETEKIWNGIVSKKLPYEIQEIARRKLRMLNSSQDINDLKIPPSNRLEKLKGKLNSYYSIRINNQWRIIFEWLNDDAFEVEIIDYH